MTGQGAEGDSMTAGAGGDRTADRAEGDRTGTHNAGVTPVDPHK